MMRQSFAMVLGLSVAGCMSEATHLAAAAEKGTMSPETAVDRATRRAVDAAAEHWKRCGDPKSGTVKIGMTRAQVLSSCWRGPNHQSKTQTSEHIYEIFTFNGGFDTVYLTDGVVTMVQSSY